MEPADTGNDFDGNAVFFQYFDNADMGKAFGSAAAERQPDNGFRFGWLGLRQLRGLIRDNDRRRGTGARAGAQYQGGKCG